jgi:dTDP-glucose 4,6-dehydratase
MKSRVLLTGAGGAIGVHVVCHIMLNTDWEIIATDSFRHKGYFDRISEVCKKYPEWRERIQIITHDLTAPLTEREVKRLEKIDYIINLASISDVQASIDDPTPSVRNNIELMLTMLELARALKPKVFLHFSTDEVYGPAPKDSEGHKEWSAIVPSNPYAASKAAQEALAIAWWRSFDVPLIITNTMNNFGEMQAPSKFPAMIQTKIQNGESIDVHVSSDGQIGTRYYIHSRNAADAVLFILNNIPPVMHSSGEIDRPLRFNIVGDKQVSNLELVQIIGKLIGKEPQYKLVNFHGTNPGHDLHYGLDGAQLASRGWKSPVSFEDSLRGTIEWQIKHHEWL